MEKEITPYNVFIWDFNHDTIEPYNIMPYLLKSWEEELKRDVKLWKRDFNPENKSMPETFDEYKEFVESVSMYQFWSRCEYEVIITGWPVQKNEEKIDVYWQIKNNIDAVTKCFLDNLKKIQ